MLPTPVNYAIYPSVVRAGVESEIFIVPTEKAFLFVEDQEYKVTVIGVDNDEMDYKTCKSHQIMMIKGHRGVLQFSFLFHSEQEYQIKIETMEPKLLGSVFLYALEEDLYALKPLKTDLHSHSFRSDGMRDPSAEAGHYREQGYDCFALTDHNRFYPGGEIDETFQGVKTEFFRIPGEEVHTPGNIIHIVHVGGTKSVAAQYVNDTDGYLRETEEYKKKVPADIPAEYTERYAMAMWATDKIHEAGGLAIFPHPFWRPGKSSVNNVRYDFAKRLIKSGMFDAYELIGGMGQVGNNLSIALWGELRADGVKIPVVASSDVHKIEGKLYFPYLFTISFAKERNAESVLESIRKGMTVAVESTGSNYDLQHRCYGSYRLVAYAHFLLRQYFLPMQRICASEGVAMRAYAMGEADKQLIEVQAEFAAHFRARFFGQEPPVLPSDAMLEFEERWRDVQRKGPQTRGSSIATPPVTMQI